MRCGIQLRRTERGYRIQNGERELKEEKETGERKGSVINGVQQRRIERGYRINDGEGEVANTRYSKKYEGTERKGKGGEEIED